MLKWYKTQKWQVILEIFMHIFNIIWFYLDYLMISMVFYSVDVWVYTQMKA